MRESGRPKYHRRPITAAAAGVFLALLVLPAFAVRRSAQTLDARLLLGYLGFICGWTLLLYRRDKRSAVSGDQRTPELTLHWMEFLGGWPVAFLAQRVLRHKIVKTRYQIKFWLIIALHELASFDSVQDWKYSGDFFSFLAGKLTDWLTLPELQPATAVIFHLSR